MCYMELERKVDEKLQKKYNNHGISEHCVDAQ